MPAYNEELLEGFEDDQKKNSSSRIELRRKKPKILWTKCLHKKFVEAVEKLGVDNAVPKKIVELMKVDGLTRDHVASHLQKYRILLKSMSDKDSMRNGASWNNSSIMLNQEKKNFPSYNRMHANYPTILDTSSSYFSVLEACTFNATTSTESVHSSSLPYEGYSMQAMTNYLDQQRNLISDATEFVNSSYSRFVQNMDGFIYDYGGCSTEVHVYKNFEVGPSSGVQNSSNSSLLQNPNSLESNYSSQSGFVEMHGNNSISYLENGMEEDDLILNEADVASLLSYVDDNDEYSGTTNQDMNGDNFLNIAALDSYHNELTSIEKHLNLDGYLSGFDPNFNKYYNEQLIEPIWSPYPIAKEMTLESLLCNYYAEDQCKNQDLFIA